MFARTYRGATIGALLAANVVLGISCSGTRSRGGKLDYARMRFNEGVKWGAHRTVATLLKRPLGDRYLDHTEKEEGKLKVSEVEPLRLTMGKKGDVAILRYRYRWHRVDEGIVKRSIVVQHWKFVGGSWRVVKVTNGPGDDFPLFQDLEKPPPRKKPKQPTKPPATSATKR